MAVKEADEDDALDEEIEDDTKKVILADEPSTPSKKQLKFKKQKVCNSVIFVPAGSRSEEVQLWCWDMKNNFF